MQLAVTILGSNSALPVYDRFPSSQVLDTGEELYMIDCGEGAQIQLNRYRIRRSRISRIFISHMHGDHVYGLAGLIGSCNHFGRKKKLTLYGPEGLREMIETQLKWTGHPLQFELEFILVDPARHSLVCEAGPMRVYSIPLRHRVPACGYRFVRESRERKLRGQLVERLGVPYELREGIKRGKDYRAADGRLYTSEELTEAPPPPVSYVYLSDTAYAPEVVPLIEGTDLLYHETTFARNLQDKAERTGHSTTADAARIARQARVGRLLIGHFSSRYRKLDGLLVEAREGFLDTELATEGCVFYIN